MPFASVARDPMLGQNAQHVEFNIASLLMYILQVNLTGGVAYAILVDSKGSQFGTYQIDISSPLVSQSLLAAIFWDVLLQISGAGHPDGS